MNWTIKLALLMLIGCGGGGLTLKQLEDAKAVATPLRPKNDTWVELSEALGKPTGEDETSTWWQTGGAECKKLKVTWMGGVTGTANIEDC